MGGHADLDPENVLIDGLVADVIDGLRGDLHPQFGVRPYRVFTIRREWAGEAVGEGEVYQDRETELVPAPRVMNLGRYEQERGGINERGETVVKEVSLTYAFGELTGDGMGLAANEQWLIRIDDGAGQGNPSRYYTHNRPPFVDREEDMGWVLYLRAVDPPGCAEP